MKIKYHYDSPLGGITLASDGKALTGLWFDGQKYFGSSLDNEENLSDHCQNAGSIIDQTLQWLDIYFSGKEPEFTPPLNIEPGKNKAATEFRKKVWEILLMIPYGRTITYKEIAGKIAESEGRAARARSLTRAVGGAVGHNPISLIIPCHRVLGSDGSLTGYAAGKDKKEQLLRMEGIVF